jgi:hypothetical protein
VCRYIAKLERDIASLAARKGLFKDISVVYPALCMAHCQHHYVFCLPRKNAPALIVAIFHERMDLIVRLAERLNEKDHRLPNPAIAILLISLTALAVSLNLVPQSCQ